MKPYLVAMAAACLIAMAPVTAFADEAAERAAIHKLLDATFDKPDSRLVVDPIVVEETYAVADWTQGEMGGRGLLRKNGSDWVLILCSGDALKSIAVFRDAGIAETIATKLVAKLTAAEARLDRGRLEHLSRFDGVMRMDGGGAGPSHAK